MPCEPPSPATTPSCPLLPAVLELIWLGCSRRATIIFPPEPWQRAEKDHDHQHWALDSMTHRGPFQPLTFCILEGTVPVALPLRHASACCLLLEVDSGRAGLDPSCWEMQDLIQLCSAVPTRGHIKYLGREDAALRE